MGDELTSLAAMNRGGDADLGPELIGLVCLALADAFDLGGAQAVDLGTALAAILPVDAASQMQRPGKPRRQIFLAFDLTLDVSDHAAELGLERPERLAGALELTGMGVTLVLDQRIGVLPDFIGANDSWLVPLMPDTVEITHSFWLVTHADLRAFARIKAWRAGSRRRLPRWGTLTDASCWHRGRMPGGHGYRVWYVEDLSCDILCIGCGSRI